MRCSFPNQRPGRCDLCGKALKGDSHAIEDMVTRQRGKCCGDCLTEKVWQFGPCCRKG